MNDLGLALVVARVAVKNNMPIQSAADLFTHALGKKLKQKKNCNFAVPSLRSTRSQMRIFAVILKMKGICNYKCCSKTVQSLAQYTRLLTSDPWTVCPSRRALFVCHLLECLLLAYSGHYEAPAPLAQSQELLLEAVTTVFARCDMKHPQMTECLLTVTAQLVFVFRYPDGTNNRLFPLFCSAVGISPAKRMLSSHTLARTSPVLTSEILAFQVDLVHLFCTKYDPPSLASAHGILMACLAIHEEPHLLEHLDSLLW